MRIGFTGTQQGMTDAQKERLLYQLEVTKHLIGSGHHGDCIGADAEFHNMLVRLGIEPVIHPPDNPDKRAFCSAKIIHEPKPYLVRNKDIVNATHLLIGTPKGFKDELRSGTWSTIRYAKKIGRPFVIIFPDGSGIDDETKI